MKQSLVEIIQNKQTVVLLGAGGVGKTTTSVALAYAAAKLGRRVGLLSIDPARRLASALGISIGTQLQEIHLPDLPEGGSLHAAMIDQKEVFDNMVRRHAPNEKVRDKILGHGLYVACAEYLGGAVEYMALAQLQDMVDSKRFDLVILDTPPAHHVLDFLNRPNILADFFDSQVTRILLKPILLASKFGLTRFMSYGEKMMGGLAKVAGMRSLELLAEFMVLLQDVLAGFNKAGEKIMTTLRDKNSAFLCITAPRVDAVELSLHIVERVGAMNFPLQGFIWNRDTLSLLPFVKESLDERREVMDEKTSEDLEILYQHFLQHQELLQQVESTLENKIPIFRLPDLQYDLHSVTGMMKWSSELLK